MTNQVAPAKPVEQPISASMRVNLPSELQAPLEPTKDPMKIKVSVETQTLIWAVFNLFMPAFSMYVGCDCLLHTYEHFLKDKPKVEHHHNNTPDGTDDEHHIEAMYCHYGEGLLSIIFWIIQNVALGMYYIISFLFLYAALNISKNRKHLRRWFVWVYKYACMSLLPVWTPALHFGIMIGNCYTVYHFWTYFLIPWLVLLLPMSIIGSLVAQQYLKKLRSQSQAGVTAAPSASRLGDNTDSRIAIATNSAVEEMKEANKA